MTFIRRIFRRVAMICLCCSSLATAAVYVEDGDSLSPSDVFSIRFRSFNVPTKRILLLRAGNEFCALRIDAYGTADINGNTVKYADYELFRMRAGELHVKMGKIESGRLEFKGYSGLGHWTWERGNTVLKCGRQQIGWSYPNKFGLVGDREIAVAPTAWTNFSEINFLDSRLQWFTEDKSQTRGEKVISNRSLPGFSQDGEAKP